MQLQSETDDEIILSPQGSLSPIDSAEEEEFEEVEQPQKHRQQPQNNYYDPDLYCLRRSNRRKEKESASVDVKKSFNCTFINLNLTFFNILE